MSEHVAQAHHNFLGMFPEPKYSEFLKRDLDHEAWAVNNYPITTYGRRSLTLNFGLPPQFDWMFIVDIMNNNTLGANNLSYFELVVNI